MPILQYYSKDKCCWKKVWNYCFVTLIKSLYFTTYRKKIVFKHLRTLLQWLEKEKQILGETEMLASHYAGFFLLKTL